MKIAAPETARSGRTIIALLAALAGGIAFRVGINTSELTVWIPVVALVAAGIAALIPHLGAQFFARAQWWSNLVLGVILCVLGSGREKSLPGVGLTLGCGVALVLADRRALAAAADAVGFRPAAYAGTIELVAILALADAQTLFLFAAISADRSHSPTVYFGAASLALIVGFVGVYKLRLWGIFVTMTTAAVLSFSLLVKLIPHVDKEMDHILWVLCAAQILAPVPMLVSIASKTPLPSPSPRIRSMLASGFVVLVMLFATAMSLLGER
jgi:hypothetical protein